ncbi:MAG TPA: putative toxin-antitoxin system toxin component, PIN family [bacterium]|nr:putative toxin-antitoxin system toxin component, PIN family [bacterium]
MKIFIDTNVLVSAFATRGLCADVVREVFISHQLVISAQLLTEFKSILRSKFEVPNELIEELIELLQRDTLFSTTCPLSDIEINDKDDVIILSSALNGNADLFITGDKELLELRKVNKMEIVSPRAFWEKLKARATDEF